MIYKDPFTLRNSYCILPLQEDQSIFKLSPEDLTTNVFSGKVCQDPGNLITLERSTLLLFHKTLGTAK